MTQWKSKRVLVSAIAIALLALGAWLTPEQEVMRKEDVFCPDCGAVAAPIGGMREWECSQCGRFISVAEIERQQKACR